MKRKVAAVTEMPAEYDFDYTKAARGKYFKRLLAEGSNVVVLEPDVAKAFPTSEAVNEALRIVMKAGQSARRRSPRPTTSRAKAPRTT
jgi:hypothetical protein